MVAGLSSSEPVLGLLAENVAALEEFADFLAPLPQSSVLVIIFLKNVSALLISFVFSPLFCLVPIIALVINGWLLGLVSTMVIERQSLGYLLAGLLPHGIFELPAFFMGEAVALSFGAAVILSLFKKDKGNIIRSNLRQNLRYFLVAIILLLPAAIIEVYVTPLLLS